MRIEFGADEVVVEPEDRIALLGAPLIIAEHDHGDAGPLFAADRAHLVHGNAEGAVAGKADARRIRIADLGADDRREAVAAGPEQTRRQIFAALLEGRIGVADSAIVADVARYDGIFRQTSLDGAPGLPRRHAVGIALACVFVPGRARIVVLVIHAGKRLPPARLGGVDQRLAVFAAVITGRRRQLRQDRLGDELGVATDADGERLGEADAGGIDIDLDYLGVLRPVIDAIAGQRRKRIEPRAQGEHHVGLGDQLHRRLRAVVAERADGKAMAAREAV